MIDAKPRTGRIAVTKADWARPVTASYEFRTSVITAYDGSEQRAALRQEPRMAVGFKTLLGTSGIERHLRDLTTGQADQFIVSMPWRAESLAADASGATLTLANLPFWCAPGEQVILDGATEEVATVQSVSGNTVSLTAEPVGVFRAGDRLFHAAQAWADGTVDFRAHTDSLWEASVEYRINPGVSPIVPLLAPAQFDGRDVFLARPDWRRQPRVSLTAQLQMFDPGRGLFDLRTPVPYSTRQVRLGFTEVSAEAAESLAAFFLRQKGKRGAFYAPAFGGELRARVTAPGGSSNLEIEGPEFRTAYENHPVLDCIHASFPDGSYQINRIAAFQTTLLNDTLLTLTDPWTQDVTSETVLSWCPLWRFAADKLEVKWLTNEVATVEMTLQTLPKETP